MTATNRNLPIPGSEPVLTVVEVSFPILGLALPSNNGYPLLGAIAEVMNSEYLRPGESLESVGGRLIEKGVIRVTPDTRLRIRTFRARGHLCRSRRQSPRRKWSSHPARNS